MVRENNPRVLSVSALTGDPVYNTAGEKLGSLEDIVIDASSGRIAYAVLSFGGILGIGDKLFAIPWGAMQLDVDNKRILFDVPKERLELAPGFDKNNWPDMADERWGAEIYGFYGQTPYWEMSEVHAERRDIPGLGDVSGRVEPERPEDRPKDISGR
jgi:sporulation protein YlmC with PRC-barrel domain